MFAVRRFACLSALFLLVAGLSVGCSDDRNKPPKIKTISGIAKKVDLKNKQVSMLFKNDKGMELTLEGYVQDDTEVWINGKAHKLDDVREGDTVTVTGYKDKSSTEPKLIAQKIEVVRPESGDWKKQDKPAGDTTAGAVKSGEPIKAQ